MLLWASKSGSSWICPQLCLHPSPHVCTEMGKEKGGRRGKRQQLQTSSLELGCNGHLLTELINLLWSSKRGEEPDRQHHPVPGVIYISGPHQQLLELTLCVSCLLLLEVLDVCFTRSTNSSGWKCSESFLKQLTHLLWSTLLGIIVIWKTLSICLY